MHFGRTKNPTYLIKTPYSYCFRLRVPVDIQPDIGKKELRYSLKTGSLGQAKRKARLIVGLVHNLFDKIRKSAGDMSKLTTDRIQALIENYVRNTLQAGEEDRTLRGPFDWQEWHAHGCAITDALEEESAALIYRDHVRVMGDTAEVILTAHGIDIDKDSDEYKTFCRELLKASIGVLKIELECEQGGEDYQHLLIDQSTTIASAVGIEKPPTSAPKLQKVIDSFIQENLRANRWGPRTIPSYTNHMKLLVRFIGNVLVDSIGPKMMQDYKTLLMKLPGGVFKTKRYQGMSFKSRLIIGAYMLVWP